MAILCSSKIVSFTLEPVVPLSIYSISSISTISLESKLKEEFPKYNPICITNVATSTISPFPNSCSYTACATLITCAT